MSSSFDFGKLSDAAKEEQTAHESTVYKRAARLTNRFGGRLMLDENDKICEAAELLLGCKPGGIPEALKALGLTTEPTGPRELTDGKENDEEKDKTRPLPVFNDDGTNAGVALREKEAVQAGYGFKMDGSTHVGWQKPPTGPNAPAAPNQAADQVPVHDKSDKDTGRKISIAEGVANKKLEAIPGPDGKVMYFREKSILIRR
ncbi:MAG TPA: hypothetical protein VHD60_00145 [Candidatus Saccharimonadales bacterium]|nr:hypothetical protein [Candidatus Saccharimonadales bacterium]